MRIKDMLETPKGIRMEDGWDVISLSYDEDYTHCSLEVNGQLLLSLSTKELTALANKIFHFVQQVEQLEDDQEHGF